MWDSISDAMTENAVKNKVADRMRRLCSRREYCVADIRRKLSDALEGDRDAVHEVLDCLIREQYVDDMRYASAFARDKASIAGWGSIKIRHALLAKGVDRVIIGEALKEVDCSKAEDRMEKLMANKYRSLKDDPQCRLKMLRFGLGRGYPYDEINETIEKLIRENEEI